MWLYQSSVSLMWSTGHCPSEHRYREWIFGQFLLWMLKDFVIGLVKSLFYVTESVGHKYVLRFYRRHVWARLQDQAFRYISLTLINALAINYQEIKY